MAKTQDNSRVLQQQDCNRVYKPVSGFARHLRSHDRPVTHEQQVCTDGDTPANKFITT